jgi:hypothetical protein
MNCAGLQSCSCEANAFNLGDNMFRYFKWLLLVSRLIPSGTFNRAKISFLPFYKQGAPPELRIHCTAVKYENFLQSCVCAFAVI